MTRTLQRVLASAVLFLAGPVLAQGYGDRQDWTSYWNGSLNISVYVFRDANGNGVFDLADRPLVGIGVEATGNDFRKYTTSNMSGFANFRMSATRNDADITTAGRYELRTIVPSGWSITTGNGVQQIDFQLRPGAPADLIAVPAPSLVGMAPDLNISGRVVVSGALTAEGPDGEMIEIVPDAEGRFSFPAARGTWHIKSQENGKSTLQRRVEVRDAPVVISAISAQAPASSPEGHVVSFDDLVSAGVYKVPTGYGGLAWENFVASHQSVYPAAGYPNTTNSGEFVVYNGSGHPAAIYAHHQPFTFVGGYFGSGTEDAEGETVRVAAWRGDELAYSETLTLSAIGQIYFLADFVDITRIEFTTDHYWHFVCDDMSFATR